MEFTKDIKFNNNPTVNQETTITYNGFLNNSDELTIVYGYGENWENTTETKMNKTESGFVASINIQDFETFNFCFRNSNYAWDNNCNCNYVSQILPAEISETVEESSPVQENNIKNFEICTLIEDILQSVITEESNQESVEKIEITENPVEEPIAITEAPVDLGKEITKVLSEINYEPIELNEYSSLDEILTSTVIEESSVEMPSEKNVDTFVDELIQNTQNFAGAETESSNEEEKSLVPTEDPFVISSRQLSRFYLLKKRIKLILYKIFIKFPKYMLGFDD